MFHRDLKPGNILLKFDQHSRLQAKVCDFGMSKLAPSSSSSPITAPVLVTQSVGTPAFMAPEVMKTFSPSTSVDAVPPSMRDIREFPSSDDTTDGYSSSTSTATHAAVAHVPAASVLDMEADYGDASSSDHDGANRGDGQDHDDDKQNKKKKTSAVGGGGGGGGGGGDGRNSGGCAVNAEQMYGALDFSRTPFSLRQCEQMDVFSFGVVLWTICTLQHPYRGMAPMDCLYFVHGGGRLDVKELTRHGGMWGKRMTDLIQFCWAHDPDERPAIDHVTVLLQNAADLLLTTP